MLIFAPVLGASQAAASLAAEDRARQIPAVAEALFYVTRSGLASADRKKSRPEAALYLVWVSVSQRLKVCNWISARCMDLIN